MKELTIEQKAKAYDDLLVKLQKAKVDNDICDERYCCVINSIVPELKESEDEKIIRKRIIDALHGDVLDIEETDKAIAWLEKQGEQKPAEYTLEQAAGIFLDALSNSPYNNKPITDAQVITKELLKFLADASSYNPNAVNEPKPAWSEEDEKKINYLIALLQNSTMHNSVLRMANEGIENWLKSLKDRYTWKPSDEQIKALSAINVTGAISYAGQGQELIDLYNDLKNLREE